MINLGVLICLFMLYLFYHFIFHWVPLMYVLLDRSYGRVNFHFSKKTVTQFSKLIVLVYRLTAIYVCLISFTSSIIVWDYQFCFLFFILANIMVVQFCFTVVLIGISLMNNDVKHLMMYVWSFLEFFEWSIESSVWFSYWQDWLLTYKSSQDKFFVSLRSVNIFSQSVSVFSFHYSIGDLWKAYALNFGEVQLIKILCFVLLFSIWQTFDHSKVTNIWLMFSSRNFILWHFIF